MCFENCKVLNFFYVACNELFFSKSKQLLTTGLKACDLNFIISSVNLSRPWISPTFF